EFYYEANGGLFFKDIEFEQWGMRIYSFDELEIMNQYVRTWKENLLEEDLVVGEFLGDLDLVIISKNSNYSNKVIIAIPIYSRDDWFFLDMNFMEFIERYISSSGEKFWETK
ncbi:MAG: hypothetical protein MUE30_07790, partial [Spirosomaceae bacterium]|nr:hypothetical protein [Spirosomataceae bacterium]